MVPANLHEFFSTSGSVTGALIGLLFVAVSVSGQRLAREGADTQSHRIRASAALTAFTNALAVSLFALLPGQKIGTTAFSAAIVGIIFVTASTLSLIRLGKMRWPFPRDLIYLAGLLVVFVIQLINGWDVSETPSDAGGVDTIAFLVVVFSLIGVFRSWELIGGPNIAFRQEVTKLVQHTQPDGDDNQ
jgi:phosphatidylserine synthase